MATVVINTSGIVATSLHLYLSSRNTFIAGPPCYTEPAATIHTAPSHLRQIRPPVQSPSTIIPTLEPPPEPPKMRDRSRFSTNTVGSNNLRRLGEDFKSLMTSLLNSPASSSSFQTPQYFRDDSLERRHFRSDSDVSVVRAFKHHALPSLTAAHTQIPQRQSRHGVPLVNVDREQDLGNSAPCAEVVRETQ